MKPQIQTSLEYLATLCLENSETHHEYSDKDLENATTIFAHVLFDVVYTENRKELTDKGMIAIAENTGNMVRELIRVATGKDMHDIVKNNYKK